MILKKAIFVISSSKAVIEDMKMCLYPVLYSVRKVSHNRKCFMTKCQGKYIALKEINRQVTD
jgi:hypothetical protein